MAPRPGRVERVAGAGQISLQVPIGLRGFEIIPVRGREEAQRLCATLSTALDSPASEVRLTLPGHRGRPFVLARGAALDLLDRLARAHAEGADAILSLDGCFSGKRLVHGAG